MLVKFYLLYCSCLSMFVLFVVSLIASASTQRHGLLVCVWIAAGSRAWPLHLHHCFRWVDEPGSFLVHGKAPQLCLRFSRWSWNNFVVLARSLVWVGNERFKSLLVVLHCPPQASLLLILSILKSLILLEILTCTWIFLRLFYGLVNGTLTLLVPNYILVQIK